SRAEQSNPNASLKFFFILSRHRQNPIPGSGLTRNAARRIYVSISTFSLPPSVHLHRPRPLSRRWQTVPLAQWISTTCSESHGAAPRLV
ncbi:hypothetical protein TorRG33x02_266200, partial [Trema orientale]